MEKKIGFYYQAFTFFFFFTTMNEYKTNVHNNYYNEQVSNKLSIQKIVTNF